MISLIGIVLITLFSTRNVGILPMLVAIELIFEFLFAMEVLEYFKRKRNERN